MLLWWPFWTPLVDAQSFSLGKVLTKNYYSFTHGTVSPLHLCNTHSVQAKPSAWCLHIAGSSISIYLLWKDNSSMLERYISSSLSRKFCQIYPRKSLPKLRCLLWPKTVAEMSGKRFLYLLKASLFTFLNSVWLKWTTGTNIFIVISLNTWKYCLEK